MTTILLKGSIIWKKHETALDEEKRRQHIQLQEKFSRQGKSIWGKKECSRGCAACCYKFQVEEVMKTTNYSFCAYQKSNGDCERHGKTKPQSCSDYNCWGERGYPKGTPLQRYELLRIAIDVIKNKKEKDLQELLDDDWFGPFD